MTKNVVKATGLLLLINVCVKLLSFVREMVIANGFGASSASDAYLVAFTFPNFFQSILGYAFVSAALPVINGCWQRENGREEAFVIGSSLLNFTALVMAVLVALGMIFAPALVWLFAPNFSAETAALSARLTRIIMPSLLFAAVAMMMSAILNSRYRFAAAAIGPGLASLGIIIATLFFAHGDIRIVAVGTLVGYLAFMLLLAADLPRAGFSYRPVCDLSHPQVKRVLRSMLPILLGLAVTQCYTIVNRIFASGMTEGSISALNYANKVMNLPISLFVVAVITAVFPKMAEEAGRQDEKALGVSLSRALTMILLLTVPATVGLLLLDQPIVELLFQRGSFDATATRMTADALFAMSPGLIFLAASMLMLRVFYAEGDVKTPLLVGAVSILVNVLASLALMKPLGHVGLAWANSLAAAANAGLLAYVLQRRLGCFGLYLRRSLVQILGATLIMGIALFIVLRVLGPASALAQVAVSIAAALIVYFVCLKLCRAQILSDTWQGLRLKS